MTGIRPARGHGKTIGAHIRSSAVPPIPLTSRSAGTPLAGSR
jgi:hypothetical protein